MSEPILTLDALAPVRPYVEIRLEKDAEYERFDLAVPEDFGLLETGSLQRLMLDAAELHAEAQKLPDDTPLSRKDTERLVALLDRGLDMILRPNRADRVDVLKSHLNSTKKIAIMSAFGAATADQNRATPPPPGPSTSGNSSPNSPRRTRASRAGTRCRSAN